MAAMVAVLNPLRRLACYNRLAYGDTPEARFADALRLMLADLVMGDAVPGSDEMAAARSVWADLRPDELNEDLNDE